jgi:uncharacterized HAD superfamily protein
VAKVYGIDLDGVCFDFTTAFSSWLKYHLQIDYNDDDIVEYHWYKCIPQVSEKDFFTEFHRFGHAGMYANLDLLPGATTAIRRILDNGHKLWFVTARPKYAKAQTIDAVKAAFGVSEKQIVFSGGTDYKSEAVKLLGIDVFVEDGPHYAESIATSTRALVYLMDKPYNRKLEHSKIIRVTSWDDVMQEEGLYENRNSLVR